LRYGLRSTLVVRLIDGPDEFKREQLGRTCAELLTETLEADDVLGISWGRTLHSMVGHLSRLPGCTVVQLVGSVPTLELDVNSMELFVGGGMRRRRGIPAPGADARRQPGDGRGASARPARAQDHRHVRPADQSGRGHRGVDGQWIDRARGAAEELALELDAAAPLPTSARLCSTPAVPNFAPPDCPAGSSPSRGTASSRSGCRGDRRRRRQGAGHSRGPSKRLIHRLITDEEAARLLLADEEDSKSHEDDATNRRRGEKHGHGYGLQERHSTRFRAVRGVARLDPRLRLCRDAGSEIAAGKIDASTALDLLDDMLAFGSWRR